MECGQIKREEIVERYLTGALRPEERESFEEHYFACEQCFAALQAQRALQAELSASAPQIRAMPAPNPTSWRWTAAMMATAAVVIVAVLGIRWGTKPDLSPSAMTTQTVQPGPSLAELARFDPPTYTPVVLRGAQDDATRKFGVAMKYYQQGDYARAITGLREAAKLNPQDPGTIFFLGVSLLLADQTDDGIAVLQQSVALGDTPYLEEAHYYVAKAFLRKSDLAAAEAELQKTVQLKGDLESKAQELAKAIQALHRPSH